MISYVLPQSYAYGLVLGLGSFFALCMILITTVLRRYNTNGQPNDANFFTTADHTVKTGLTASAVVSSWTWPATLLTSGALAYEYGVSGAYLYGAGATLFVLVIAFLGIQIKRFLPQLHTIVELIKVRFGISGHIVYVFYSLSTNVIVSSCLLLGGSQAFTNATGMNVVAANFLLPIGVMVYTLVGGIQATFLSDWIHTVIMYVIILITIFTAYASPGGVIGSPSKMYDLLVDAAKNYPSVGHEGSYLTLSNKTNILLSWSLIMNCVATVLGDPSYGQKLISANPASTVPGYLMGGLCWFIVPAALGSSAGLASRALSGTPAFFTYPRLMTEEEVNGGMPVIYGMEALLGPVGGRIALLLVFLSVTSAFSSELIGASSIVTYDIYRGYINPTASSRQLINISHGSVVAFGFIMAAVSIGFNSAGVTVGWLLDFTAIAMGPTGFTISLALFWKDMNKFAMVTAPLLASVTGISCWIGTAYYYEGAVNADTLNTINPVVIGNFVSVFSCGIYIFLFSIVRPQKFDFSEFSVEMDKTFGSDKEALAEFAQEKVLRRAMRLTSCTVVVYFLGFLILIPLTMYGTKYIMSRRFFTAWIVIIMIWCVLAAAYITVYPLYESKDDLYQLFKNMCRLDRDSILDGNSSEKNRSGFSARLKH